VPNGAYAVQSPLQGVLCASVRRGVFGGARVRERDKTGDAGVTASVYEWQYAEVRIGGGGGARVEMLARTAGLRRTEAVGIIADSQRARRGQRLAGGEAGKEGGSGGARVMKLPACAA
jgi:hypothetical protein